YNATASTGFLNPYGASAVTVPFIGVNMFAGGTYTMNTSLVIAGLTNGNLFNDSLQNAMVRVNYRPNAGAPYQLCQYGAIPFGQGLQVSGCSVPIQDSVTITFNITPTADNVGATTAGTSQTVPGAGCANEFAGNYGNALVPSVLFQPGTSFPKKALLTVTNFGTSYPGENRFNLYAGLTTGAAMFAPTAQGTGGNDSSLHGRTVSQGGFYNYYRTITPTQLSGMISYLNTQPANTPINLGYFETWNDFINASDITPNAGGPTTATLKIYYQYVSADFNWFSAPTGGVSLYSLSPFNPLVTTGSPLTNSNVPGTYTFYAACSSLPTCRVPVNLVINPVPVAVQDTLALCESTPGSNSAIFDLTTMNASVSNNAPGTLVEYYNDPWLFSLIPTPTNDTTNTSFVYSKVSFASGCYASDSLLLKVNSQPDFPSPVLPPGFACSPASIDVATLINPFSTVPPGTDTLYYENPAYTIPHPNPHNITTADTVYLVFKTSSVPSCSDSAIAFIQVVPQNNFISGQDVSFNYSIAGNQGCQSMVMVDGNSDTMRSTVDCKRIAAITDIPNTTSLGSVSICQDIAASTPTHNGQPYLNRVYQITAATNDTAQVCLYYLNDDFDQYNATALTSSPTWPLLPTSAASPNVANIAITKVSNGDLNTPGHVATSISSNLINASYDAVSSVWTVCFPVNGFSYFYAHGANALGIPLPVSLLSFTGNKADGTSVLNWSTANEMNNSHFVVERSGDGTRFSAVSDKINSKALNGNSNSILDYAFTDVRPMPGHNYYRLQQNDIDGHVTYSQVVDVFFGQVGTVKLYPNPVSTYLNIEVNTPKSTMARVRITDAAGRTVQVSDLQLVAGTTKTQIDMQQLADGVYRVALSDGNGLEYSQLVRKH
ncbi:MAG: T9SS type A sorting domain-containing protein, partial [Chitinophagaceae bacterium]|nr:T9SS type A sorting domain-containing protein [Chitinophagaceae bacterium]